ncbi:MAG TPA: prepilin-type N-terminal cleavage/methylation domain-containing protein [Candidatus Dojkabacteria bacterium]|nr:prepilin-type N-terminal cleavage/methylation domain-containing protein [Candidatus Dojkabacteria bacterium]
MNRKKKIQGFSLVELVLAIGIFTIISSFLVFLVLDSTRTYENIEKRARATQITKEIYSALKYLKSEEWFAIRKETDQGPKHIEYSEGKYNIVEGEVTENSLTHSFNITLAQRDATGMLVEEGGTTDPHTRVVNISIQWTDRFGKTHTISPKLYLNDWNINSIVLTTKDDFNRGTHNDTAAAEATGGELRLQSILYPDWCRPERTMTSYDIPGEAYAKSIFAEVGKAYLGTRGGDVGDPFTKLKIEGVNPPVLTVEGTFQGYRINDIFVDGDYAYLATSDDNKEIVILDISSVPYQEVGYVNAPDQWNNDARSVFVKGNVGYLTQSTYVRSFDLSSKTGSRPILNSISISLIPWIASVSQIHVKDNYLYASLDWDWYELAILDVSNPSNMKILSRTSVNNQQVYDMHVSEDGNRVYFGTNYSSKEHEFFIIDTSVKNKKCPIIASRKVNMTVRGISVVEDGDVVVLVGTSGEEYQVFTIVDETNPIKCGGMRISSGVYDIQSILDPQGNAFSYILTGDTTQEFKIIRGGPGGGDEDTGNGFLESGTYTSEIIDSKSDTSEYYTVVVDADVPTGTSMKIQFRMASSPSTLATTPWRGVNAETPYITEGGTYHLPMGTSGRYLQYKVDFASDVTKAHSPLLKELVFEYEK